MYVGQLWTVSTNLFLILYFRESEKRGLDHKENEKCLREDDSVDEKRRKKEEKRRI